jgi:isopentenyl diphosphate isomerase/L-lactate dehydrogenase-like FMN-dependent dehydrogenase
MDINRRYPSVADMEVTAKKRLPGFVRDYLVNGLGDGACVDRNRQDLDNVLLMPRYLSEAGAPDIRCQLLGQAYDAPFGVAPIGLSGLIWPHSETILAEAAKTHNVPYTLSTVATVSLETIPPIAGENAWFQYYPSSDMAVEDSILERCRVAGYGTILLTVDVPVVVRREHDIRNGLSIPPRFNLKTLSQMMAHPQWALRMLARGVPQFETIRPYFSGGQSRNIGRSIQASSHFVKQVMKGHITADRFTRIRAGWSGKLLVKGVLNSEEAQQYLAMGADGLVISNHGGRQLDAAPSSVSVLPIVRQAVGPDATLIADSGVRSGQDIARMLALGADFVLMGRPFMYAVAALDRRGGDHVMNVLKAELRSVMGQMGCPTLKELPHFLYTDGR